jgi:hypothetical protein
MSELNATSINDLPTDPSIGGSGNVNLVINDSSMAQTTPPSQLSLDQNTISQIVNGLQQASISGATSFPSRDIPLQTEQLTRDEQTIPNYIPKPELVDYINNNNDDLNQYINAEKRQSSLDSLYDELQAPLLLAVLYFLFQLPFFKKLVFKYLPFLCHNDGNYNFNGLVFTCGFFGFIYYSLSKTVKKFSKF